MRSLRYNNMGAEGTAALAKMLPETQIKDLKCAAQRYFLRVRDGPLSHPARIETRPGRPACARSLNDNKITDGGEDMSAVIKLAKVLPQTSITNLECAAPDSAIVPAIPTCSLLRCV